MCNLMSITVYFFTEIAYRTLEFTLIEFTETENMQSFMLQNTTQSFWQLTYELKIYGDEDDLRSCLFTLDEWLIIINTMESKHES